MISIWKRILQLLDEYESMLNASIANKKQELEKDGEKFNDTKKKYLLSLLIAANAEEESKTQLTLEELRAYSISWLRFPLLQSYHIFIAGHDTTAIALIASIYLLAINPVSFFPQQLFKCCKGYSRAS